MRNRILTCLVLVCLCTTPAIPPSPAVGFASPVTRSNIVVVMADDLDVHTLNRAISRGYMPNLVRYIVSRGVSFSNAFVTYPVCCPSRATFLTGQYAHNHNVRSNLSPSGGVTKLDDASTIGTWLHDAGYRTGYVGRYLNDTGRSDVNKDNVRDVNDINYVPPGWDDWQALFEPSTSWMYNFAINDNGVFAVHGSTETEYQTDVPRKAVGGLHSRIRGVERQPAVLSRRHAVSAPYRSRSRSNLGIVFERLDVDLEGRSQTYRYHRRCADSQSIVQ